MEKDQLYVQVVDKNVGLARKRQVIVKEEDKKRILKMCHEGIDGMHFGRDKTYGKVALQFVTSSSYLLFVYFLSLSLPDLDC